jgi:hypothetical protein
MVFAVLVTATLDRLSPDADFTPTNAHCPTFCCITVTDPNLSSLDKKESVG